MQMPIKQHDSLILNKAIKISHLCHIWHKWLWCGWDSRTVSRVMSVAGIIARANPGAGPSFIWAACCHGALKQSTPRQRASNP